MNSSARTPRRPNRLACALGALSALLGLLLGAAMLLGAAGFALDYGRLLRHGVEAAATVTDRQVEYRGGRGGGYENVLYYRFERDDVAVEGRESVDAPVYEATAPGAPIAVLYQPGNPANHFLKDKFGIKWWLFLPLTLGLFGLLLAGLCGWALAACLRMAISARP